MAKTTDEVFWELLEKERSSDFRQSLRDNGCLSESWAAGRCDAMGFHIRSTLGASKTIARDYELFYQGVKRLGEATARSLGVSAILRQEKHRSAGGPPCPDCGSFDMKRPRSDRVQWQCRECQREFGAPKKTRLQELEQENERLRLENRKLAALLDAAENEVLRLRTRKD